MDDVLMAVVVFSGLALVFKVIADATVRHKLINRAMVNENVQHLFSRGAGEYLLSNLKWGMVLVGIGLALLIVEFTPYWRREGMMYGLMFLFAGIGFLVYYTVAKGRIKDDKDRSPKV